MNIENVQDDSGATGATMHMRCARQALPDVRQERSAVTVPGASALMTRLDDPERERDQVADRAARDRRDRHRRVPRSASCERLAPRADGAAAEYRGVGAGVREGAGGPKVMVNR